MFNTVRWLKIDKDNIKPIVVNLHRLILFTGIFCTVFVQTSAYCLFVINDYYGYTCELGNVTANNFTEVVDLSGDHIGGRTNVHVQAVIVSPTARLEEVPTIIFTTFFNLEQLVLSSNVLRRIELPFCGPRMRILQFNVNPISVVQNGAFRGCRSIETLILLLNDIERVEDDVFEDLPQLRELVMFGNPLDVIQGHLFRNIRQLQYLRLDQGSLTSVQPGAFQCKEFLYEIDLRVNRLERIGTGTFTNLLRLRTLNLGSNNIQVIEEGAFANLPLLERLELVENQIAVFDSNLFGTTFPNLSYLGLGSNQIHAVDRRVFRRFLALRSFYGVNNVCFSENFVDIASIENDVLPHMETCFTNFEDL